MKITFKYTFFSIVKIRSHASYIGSNPSVMWRFSFLTKRQMQCLRTFNKNEKQKIPSY